MPWDDKSRFGNGFAARRLKEEIMPAELTEPMLESFQSAACKLTGFRRRQLQAAITLKCYDGRWRRAERALGWGRVPGDTG